DDFGRFANSPGSAEYILEKGNYFIRVYPYYSGIDGSSNYAVTFSVTPQPTLPTDPGNTTNQALNIGTLSGSRTYRDYVGVTDGQDYYRFTLNGRKKVNLSFTAENGYLNFALGSDTNQSGILESNEFLTSFGTRSSAVREVTLEAGTYFAVVYPYYSGVNGSSQYSLTLSVPGNSTADFNKDGKTDILLNNPNQGWNTAWLMDGTNYAGFANVFGSAGYRPVATADFNKDGKTDLV
ncbi:MAG: FG-GAP repeat domain-containing protein, partial [Sphaerospermopsis kisseleviana]